MPISKKSPPRRGALDVPQVGHPRIVTVPRQKYLTLSGTGLAPVGEPGAQTALQAAIAALYSLAFTMKFARKREGGDLDIGPIEADWWVPDGVDPRDAKPSQWRWQLFLPVPGVTLRELIGAVEIVRGRDGGSPLIAGAELVTSPPTRCAEALHVGPYEAEGPTIEAMLAYAEQHGWKTIGRHREIYLNDPRRSPPAKLKTVLRQPVVRA